MPDYTPIPDPTVEPDAPITSELMFRLRDNPLGMFEGADGAPKLQDAALSTTTGAVTAAGATWVGRRMAAMPGNAVGSYIFAELVPRTGLNPPINFGTVVSGADLRYTDAGGENQAGAATIPGNWACCGYLSGIAPSNGGLSTLWQRVT